MAAKRNAPSNSQTGSKKMKIDEENNAKKNFIGVILSFRPPAKSQGKDYSCTVEIVNEAEVPIKCIIFNASNDRLPQSCSIGDIICIKRATASRFQNTLQIIASNVSSWMLFRKSSLTITPETCSEKYTFTDVEKNRIQKLRDWAAKRSFSEGSFKCLPVTTSTPDTPTRPNPQSVSETSFSQPQSVSETSFSQPQSVSETSSSQPLPIDLTTSLAKLTVSSSDQPINKVEPSANQAPPSSGVSSKEKSPKVSVATSKGKVPGKTSPKASPFRGFPPTATSSSNAPKSTGKPVQLPKYTKSYSKPSSRRHYRVNIVRISTIKAGDKNVGTCGLVKYFKPVAQAKGLDYYVTFGLIDPSFPKHPFSCTLFNPSKDMLPIIHSTGDIVLAKGLKTSSYQNHVQARGFDNILIGVCSSDLDIPSPMSLGNWYSVSGNEKATFCDIKTWYVDQGPLLLNTSFEEVSSGHYFNIICRVASVSFSEQTNDTVLTVCDGTMMKISCKRRDTQYTWKTNEDPQLMTTYENSLYDLHIPNYTPKEGLAGSYVLLSNVYARPLPKLIDSDQPEVELVLLIHELIPSTIEVLANDCITVCKFKQKFPAPIGPFPTIRKPSRQCVFYVIDEPSKQTGTIEDARKASVGSVHVIKGQIMKVSPATLEEMSQLRCTMCRTRYITPKQSETYPGIPLTSGDACVFCSEPDQEGPSIQYTYAFTLCLKDQTDTMDICVSADEGVRFLSSVATATNLYDNKEASEKLLSLLYLMTGGNNPFYPLGTDLGYERPFLKCCVRSFVSMRGGDTSFTMEDTVCMYTQ